jgi:PD-(D/E)XK nuclease superfamily
MSITANLSSIWGNSENAYSGVIAQTLAVFASFRTYCLQKFISHFEREISPKVLDIIRTIVRDDVTPTSIVTEELCGTYGRTDVCIKFETLTLVIENKIGAGFQAEQLKRYDEYLRGLNDDYLLILLSPSNYRVTEHEKPLLKGRFAQLSYKTLINWFDSYLKEKTDLSELDRTYLLSVREFLGEIEMPNIAQKEIDALGAYRDGNSAIKRLTTIIKRVNEAINNPYGHVEAWLGNYILGHKKIGEYPAYFGFRYGTDWYYGAPLIANKCEAIVYVKDDEKDKDIALLRNEKVRQAQSALEKALTNGSCKVNYYERKKSEECRLAIRRSLASFHDGNVDEIQNWLIDTLEKLEEALRGG